jgi:hypothetical protein
MLPTVFSNIKKIIKAGHLGMPKMILMEAGKEFRSSTSVIISIVKVKMALLPEMGSLWQTNRKKTEPNNWKYRHSFNWGFGL